MTSIGIMQGRLTRPKDERIQFFPGSDWPSEFPLAARAGLDAIEWLYDAPSEAENPIATANGIKAIERASDETGVRVWSVCADFFRERPLIRVGRSEFEEGVRRLRWLLLRTRQLGARHVVVPFLDNSEIRTEAEATQVVTAISECVLVAESTGVSLNLEASLAPGPLRDLLDRLPSSAVAVNYDIGNSASLGYDPRDEFDAYGERIGSVHIKDRVRGGGTVPLGTGDADFEGVFQALRQIRFSGSFVLEVARGRAGEEAEAAASNRAFASRWVDSLTTNGDS